VDGQAVPKSVVALLLPALAAPAPAAELPETLPGWIIIRTPHSYPTLVQRLDAAIAAAPVNKVTAASATVGANAIGRTIPGNMVVGVFAPDLAVRMLDASIAAGIEAPLRLYLTENADGTATLSYETASHVFAPYVDGGERLEALAAELDAILAAIAERASAP
jgi:uncharacterized protein (DUF302 family)